MSSPDLDPAVRARLVDACNDPTYTYPRVRRRDVFDLLAALDAAVAALPAETPQP